MIGRGNRADGDYCADLFMIGYPELSANTTKQMKTLAHFDWQDGPKNIRALIHLLSNVPNLYNITYANSVVFQCGSNKWLKPVNGFLANFNTE